MSPRVMDAVGFISRFVEDHWEALIDESEISDELSSHGYSEREISDAYRWIEQNTLGSDSDLEANGPRPTTLSIRPGMRVLSAIESSKLKPAAHGLLMRYVDRGLLDAILLEDVIERVLRSESEEVGEREVRRITALTLFNRVQSEWKDFLHTTNTLLH